MRFFKFTRIHLEMIWAACFIAMMWHVFTSGPSKTANVILQKQISPYIVAINLCLVAAVIILNTKLLGRVKALGWSPFPWLRRFAMPFKAKYLGPACRIAIALNIPLFAFIEELVFRNDVSTVAHAVFWSLAFGFSHSIFSGSSISLCITGSLVGLWFAYLYSVGGIVLSMVHHATYNLCFVALSLIQPFLRYLKAPRPEPSPAP